ANGDSVRARHTSSASFLTPIDTTVTIGGLSDTFTSTTLAEENATPVPTLGTASLLFFGAVLAVAGILTIRRF
ncbi:MAG TPA: hypothetical protein VKH46_03275, partial [Thermoanaerobaculia bacterium]|nr:hypothetical protein [Thermoanaerobaculia bacterium]